MCKYDVPVMQWLHCGHVQSMKVVWQRSSCRLAQTPASPPPTPPRQPECTPCPAAQYFGLPVFVLDLCPQCVTARHQSSQDRGPTCCSQNHGRMCFHGRIGVPAAPRRASLVTEFREQRSSGSGGGRERAEERTQGWEARYHRRYSASL